jgi:molybdopterin converting factor small subunit
LKIKVYAPAYWDLSLLNNDGVIELSNGSTLNDLMKCLKIPNIIRNMLIVSVNYKREKKYYQLNDGDIVSILGSLSSG